MEKKPGSVRIAIPSGKIGVSWNEQGLVSTVSLDDPGKGLTRNFEQVPRRILQFLKDVEDYFASGAPFSRTRWDDLASDEWTEFQRKVYKAILGIPHGETRTYGWVATKIGTPLACRAVGQALRKNPVPLFVPCHRVVANQSIGGFMGEDSPDAPQLGLKRRLLELENRFVNPSFWPRSSIGA